MKLHDFLVITKLQIAIMTKTFFSSVSLVSLLFCFFLSWGAWSASRTRSWFWPRKYKIQITLNKVTLTVLRTHKSNSFLTLSQGSIFGYFSHEFLSPPSLLRQDQYFSGILNSTKLTTEQYVVLIATLKKAVVRFENTHLIYFWRNLPLALLQSYATNCTNIYTPW